MGIDGGRPIGKLVHVQLAQENSSCRSEPFDHSRIIFGDEIGQDLGTTGGANPFCEEEVLGCKGDPMERADISSFQDLPLSSPSCCESLSGQEGDEGVDLLVVSFYPSQECSGDFHRGYLFFSDSL